MKKIIMILATLLLIACSNNKQQEEKQTYIYQETVKVIDRFNNQNDTVLRGCQYIISACDDKEAYLQAYKIYCTNFNYLLSITADITQVSFTLEDNSSKIINPDFPEREELEKQIILETASCISSFPILGDLNIHGDLTNLNTSTKTN